MSSIGELQVNQIDLLSNSSGHVPDHDFSTLIKESMSIPVSYQVFTIIMSVFVIVLNSLVITTSGLIMKKGLEPKCTYLLLGNLSVTDMLIGVNSILWVTVFKDLKYHSRLGCCLQIGVIMTCMLVSIYTITLIAIDRFLYIMHGIKYNQLVYPKRVRMMITLTWICGTFIGLLPLLGWSNEWNEGDLCRYARIVPPHMIVFTGVIAIVPLPIIVLVYIIILIKSFKTISEIARELKIWNKNISVTPNGNGLRKFRGSRISTISETISTTSSSGYSSSISTETLQNVNRNVPAGEFEAYKPNKKKWKAIKVVIFTTGTYVVSWVPLCVVSIIVGMCDTEETPKKCYQLKYVSKYVSLLTYLNCFLNPIVYAWWHNGFQKAAKKIYNNKKQTFIEWYQRVVAK